MTTIDPAGIDIDAMVEQVFLGVEDAETNEAIHAGLVAQAYTIRLIAKACEGTKVFARAEVQFEASKSDFESITEPSQRLANAWLEFLVKFVDAPTQLHRLTTIRLCFPLVAHYLPNESVMPTGPVLL
ncbi:hypothetical protein [Pseudomonas serbica]|uniref:hypothetical protein n=1 Tax=Pseudomonas serbica TaxID=2965074 RepID=UPI00237B76AA|nr:hypothetical protein [Pseudomonas serbica]